jgi:shikimate kinase
MGSGKTTVGRRLAKRLGFAFVDADEALVARTGHTIREWFVEGEDAFREAETWMLAELLGASTPTVVATGGGVVTVKANRKRLTLDDVTVVWLRGSAKFLANRIEQKRTHGHRPLLDDDVLGTLDRLATERDRWYEAVADITIDIEPVHQHEGHPKKRLAELVEDALRSAGTFPTRAARR